MQICLLYITVLTLRVLFAADGSFDESDGSGSAASDAMRRRHMRGLLQNDGAGEESDQVGNSSNTTDTEAHDEVQKMDAFVFSTWQDGAVYFELPGNVAGLQIARYCGDGVVGEEEDCDDGIANGVAFRCRCVPVDSDKCMDKGSVPCLYSFIIFILSTPVYIFMLCSNFILGCFLPFQRAKQLYALLLECAVRTANATLAIHWCRPRHFLLGWKHPPLGMKYHWASAKSMSEREFALVTFALISKCRQGKVLKKYQHPIKLPSRSHFLVICKVPHQ